MRIGQMLEGTQSGCINHPTLPAAYRCKRCGQPVCNHCVVTVSIGRFCSEQCREQFQEFTTKAEALEAGQKRFKRPRFGPWIGKAVVLFILLGGIAFVSTVMHIPVLSPLVRNIRAMLGI